MICGKTIYPTSRDAIEAIKGMFKKFAKSPNRKELTSASRAYYCDDCQGYHLYSESKKSKRQKSNSEDVNTESKAKKENDRKFQTLIIHEPRKFKVK